jgi:hypothetical protein
LVAHKQAYQILSLGFVPRWGSAHGRTHLADSNPERKSEIPAFGNHTD